MALLDCGMRVPKTRLVPLSPLSKCDEIACRFGERWPQLQKGCASGRTLVLLSVASEPTEGSFAHDAASSRERVQRRPVLALVLLWAQVDLDFGARRYRPQGVEASPC